MNQVKVSVIIPIHNCSLYLKETLNSVLRQTLQEIEIICVDDASEDGSDQILREYASSDARIQAIYYKDCMSASQARKEAVSASSGAYIMFLDGDDELVPEACKIAFEAIEKAKTDIVQFGTLVVTVPGCHREE